MRCYCRFKECPSEFIYGVDDPPCWFEALDKQEIIFLGLPAVCYIKIGKTVLKFKQNDIIRREDLEML